MKSMKLNMTTEQKAKAYDEAKYIMKKYIESGNAGVVAENTIRKAFPELRESDDESIRKDIVTYLKSILSNKKYGDKFIKVGLLGLKHKVSRNLLIHIVKNIVKAIKKLVNVLLMGSVKLKEKRSRRLLGAKRMKELLNV